MPNEKPTIAEHLERAGVSRRKFRSTLYDPNDDGAYQPVSHAESDRVGGGEGRGQSQTTFRDLAPFSGLHWLF